MVMEASVVGMVCVGFITMMALCQNLGMFLTNSYRRNSLRLAFFVEEKNLVRRFNGLFCVEFQGGSV